MLNVIQLKKEDFFDPNTQLREASLIVTDFGENFQKEINSVVETFHSWKIAVGLSAPQVGIKKRFAVINTSKDKVDEDLIIINPVITSISGKKDTKNESCLSLPNVKGAVERRYKISLLYSDRIGNKTSMMAEGFLARVILHEIDHLDGKLFIDRMSHDSQLEAFNIPWE